MSRFRSSETEERERRVEKKKAGRGSEIEMTSCRYTIVPDIYIYIQIDVCVVYACALSVYLHSAS